MEINGYKRPLHSVANIDSEILKLIELANKRKEDKEILEWESESLFRKVTQILDRHR